MQAYAEKTIRGIGEPACGARSSACDQFSLPSFLVESLAVHLARWSRRDQRHPQSQNNHRPSTKQRTDHPHILTYAQPRNMYAVAMGRKLRYEIDLTRPARTVASHGHSVRSITSSDLRGLASLMLDAYIGTIDYDDEDLDELLVELNDLVSESLGLTDRERALVSDFVKVRLELNDGKVGRPAISKPTRAMIKQYGKRLRQELDAFLGTNSSQHHAVDVVYDDTSGMICVDFVSSKKTIAVSVSTADNETSKALTKTRDELRAEIGQWVYFDRDLRIHDGTKTYLLKPLQRFHWTESQAMIDAGEIIAETVSAEGGVG